MSSMEIDGVTDAGVEECKGENLGAAGAAGSAATAGAAATGERTQKGKGEGDRNIMLHPVCCVTSFSILLSYGWHDFHLLPR